MLRASRVFLRKNSQFSAAAREEQKPVGFDVREAEFHSVAACGVRLLEILLENETRLLLVKVIL